jgi:hypothetical protein
LCEPNRRIRAGHLQAANYSTVTLLAGLLGLSTSQPRATAIYQSFSVGVKGRPCSPLKSFFNRRSLELR